MKAYLALLLLTALSIFAEADVHSQTTFHRGYLDTTQQRDMKNGGELQERSNGDFIYTFYRSGIMCTNPIGVPLWTNDYGLPGFPASKNIVFNQSLNLPNGDLILLGQIPKAGYGQDTMVVCRVSLSGSIIWSKILPTASPYSVVNRRSIITTNGELLICASNSWPGGNNFTLATRMDLSGNILWQHLYVNHPNSGIVRQFYTWDVTECANGDFLICGFGSAPTDNIITRINSGGTILWAKKYNPYNYPGSQRPPRIRELADGTIRVIVDACYAGYGTGYFTIEGSGNVSGNGKAFNVPYYSNSFIQPSGDMVYINSEGLLKISNAGNVIFSYKYVPPVYVTLSGLCSTADGGYAAAGSYPGNTQFFSNGYLVKTTSTGTAAPYSSAVVVTDTPYTQIATAISLVDSTVSIPMQNVTLTTIPIILKDTLFSLSLSVPFTETTLQPIVYPNPARSEIFFSNSSLSDIEVFDVTGKLALKRKSVHSIDVTSLSSGVYFVRLRDELGNTFTTQRFVKE